MTRVRYLYRLPAQWVDHDPTKKRIVQPPALPEFVRPDSLADARRWFQAAKSIAVLAVEWGRTPNELRAQVLPDKDRRKGELLKG